MTAQFYAGGVPKVTAILPCYNAATFIGPTLDCLARQTWPNLEILIGEDCSTDATGEIVREFASKNSNVRLLTRESNLGWLRNCNDLMSQAKGELMFFAFHDDVLDVTYVEKLAVVLTGNAKAILAFSDLELFELDGSSSVKSFDLLAPAYTSFGRGRVMSGHPANWWVPNRGLFRASAFRDSGGIHANAAGEYSADWTWLLHLALLGDFIRVPEVLCRKRYQGKSLSKSWARSKAQREALWRAGITEIRGSKCPRITKLLLIGLIATREERGLIQKLRRWIAATLARN